MNATNEAPVVPPHGSRKSRRPAPGRHCNSPSFRDVSREYLRRETHWSYAIELLLFVLVSTVAAWPIASAAVALGQMHR